MRNLLRNVNIYAGSLIFCNFRRIEIENENDRKIILAMAIDLCTVIRTYYLQW